MGNSFIIYNRTTYPHFAAMAPSNVAVHSVFNITKYIFLLYPFLKKLMGMMIACGKGG